MGGNTRAIDRETGEVVAFADRIDLRSISIEGFRRDIVAAAYAVAAEFRSSTGSHLWSPHDMPALLDQGDAFNGASRVIFARDIDFEELAKRKPTLGDVDLTVPRGKLESLYAVLATIEGTKLTEKVTYVGQNKLEQKGHQINALFRYDQGGRKTNVQVDFEGVEYANGAPTDFALFAHSSCVIDIMRGIKGVAHKYWLTNLVRSVSTRPDALVLTEKSPLPPGPVRIRKERTAPRTHAFSVDRGLRTKLVPVTVDSQPYEIEGRPVYRELPTAESSYVTSLPDIFESVFGQQPSSEQLEMFWTFTGLVDLSRDLLDRDQISAAYDYLLEENLYGPGAQRLDRTGPKGDQAAKRPIVDALRKEFPYLTDFDDKLESLSRSFYKRY